MNKLKRNIENTEKNLIVYIDAHLDKPIEPKLPQQTLAEQVICREV